MKTLLRVGIRSKHTYEGSKDFSKGKKPGLFVNFGQFQWSVSGSAFPILIRIQDSQINADLDPQNCFGFVCWVGIKGGKIYTADRDVFKVMLDNEDYAAVKWKF